MKTQKIYNLVILDASGSMHSIYNQALSGVNETLATIRMAQEDHPELQQKVTHEDRVLVTIITDGYENASRTWSGKQIKSLVQELRQMGWTFTYIGADQDVEKVAETIGVQNSLRFSANAEETKVMFAKERKCRNKFYDKMSMFLAEAAPCANLKESDDYFDDI